MGNYVSSFANGAAVDAELTKVANSNLSATHKITRSATIVIAASDSSEKSKAQADYVCSGIDDQVTINAAISALPSSGGKIVLLEGTFIKSNVEGIAIPSNTTFEMSSGTLLKFVDGITGVNPVMLSCTSVENVSICGGVIDGNKSTSAATGIASIGISLIDCADSKIQNVKIKDIGTTEALSGYGIYLNASSGNTIDACVISGCKRESLVLFESSNFNTVLSTHSSGSDDRGFVIHRSEFNIFSGCTSDGDVNAGFDLQPYNDRQAKNNIIINNTINNTIIGIRSYGQLGAIVSNNSISTASTAGIRCGISGDGLTFEANKGCVFSGNSINNSNTGILAYSGKNLISKNVITASTGTVTKSTAGILVAGSFLTVSDNTIIGGACAGITVYSPTACTDVTIINNTCVDNASSGLLLYGNATNVSMINNVLRNNALNGEPGFQNAITIYGTNSNIVVDGNSITGGGETQAYVIRVHLNNTNVSIRNNNISATGTSGIIIDATGAAIITHNNGYVTENTGTATITAGQTSVNVSHGLAAAPTRVLLSPTTATAGKQYYVSAKAATTFTITIDSAADADISFDWQAVI